MCGKNNEPFGGRPEFGCEGGMPEHGCCGRPGRPGCPGHEPFGPGRAPFGPGFGGRPHRHHHHHMDEAEYEALDSDAKLGILFHQLRHMSRFFESRGGQFRILGILAREGSMTQRELTERLGIQPGSASEVIGKLERAGWIERSESTEDRRTADVRLTDSGREQLESIRGKKPELFSALSDEEKAQLVSMLEKLRADWHDKLEAERRARFGGEGGPAQD